VPIGHGGTLAHGLIRRTDKSSESPCQIATNQGSQLAFHARVHAAFASAPSFPAGLLDSSLLELLSQAERPLSAYNLVSLLREQNHQMAVMSVFRSLDRLCARADRQGRNAIGLPDQGCPQSGALDLHRLRGDPAVGGIRYAGCTYAACGAYRLFAWHDCVRGGGLCAACGEPREL